MKNDVGHVRWGVIGCGQIAIDRSIPGLLTAEGARLVAIADPLPARRERALALARAAGLDDVAAHGTDEALLADPRVDAVYIALPTGDHARAVAAAARAGKAILCEKPLGRGASEVREMVRVTRRHGVPLMTAYMSRFGDVFIKAVELLKAGAIGKVTFASAHFSYRCFKYYPPGAAGGWRYTDAAGGGPLLDVGVYLAFGLREMLGERVARVAAFNGDAFAPPGAAVPDTTAAWFVTESGTPGQFVTSFAHGASAMRFFGTTGNLTVEECFNQTPGARLHCRGEGIDFSLDTIGPGTLPLHENYRREFVHFTRALIHGEPHAPSVADVLADALLLDALRQDVGTVIVPSPEEFLQQP